MHAGATTAPRSSCPGRARVGRERNWRGRGEVRFYHLWHSGCPLQACGQGTAYGICWGVRTAYILWSCSYDGVLGNRKLSTGLHRDFFFRSSARLRAAGCGRACTELKCPRSPPSRASPRGRQESRLGESRGVYLKNFTTKLPSKEKEKAAAQGRMAGWEQGGRHTRATTQG